jgi:hypothetical protein
MKWQLEFQRCLDKRWLTVMSAARYLVTKELDVARGDLAEAEGGYERKSYKLPSCCRGGRNPSKWMSEIKYCYDREADVLHVSLSLVCARWREGNRPCWLRTRLLPR